LQIIPWADVIKWPENKPNGYDITDCYREGGADGFLETLTLWTEAPGVDIEPYTIDALREELQKIPMGLQTGWKDLDAYLTIQPGALTVIAGRPSHGKTTLMMNLALNMVRKYPDKSFFFFSYEEPRNKIAVKLITILGGYIIDAHQNTLQIERYIKGNNTGAGAIDSGISRYNSYASEKRLFVICNPYDVINLVNVITALNRRYNIGAIFIDYIQKIRPTEKAPSRQLEIQRISATLLETAVSLNIPMIVGAQVNREVADRKDLTDDKIREAGDIEQDANIILGVWSEGKENDPSEVDLYAKIIKNRDGQRDREVRLLFNKPILTITDATGG